MEEKETTIGDLIRIKRKHKDMTQEKLAEMTGTNREYISKLENNSAMEDTQIIYSIGKILKCEIIKRYALASLLEPIKSMVS